MSDDFLYVPGSLAIHFKKCVVMCVDASNILHFILVYLSRKKVLLSIWKYGHWLTLSFFIAFECPEYFLII